MSGLVLTIPPPGGTAGGGGGGSFDQSLNTTDSVEFDDLYLSGGMDFTVTGTSIGMVLEGEDLQIQTAPSTGDGGDITLAAGQGDEDGGDIYISGGQGLLSGGRVIITGGFAGGEEGGAIDIISGSGGDSGGAITIRAGAGVPGNGGYLVMSSPEVARITAPQIELYASTRLRMNNQTGFTGSIPSIATLTVVNGIIVGYV